MTPQPIIPAVPFTLLSSDHWAESLALHVMQENFARFMGKLAPSQQREYLRHCKDQIAREKNLAEALRSFYDNLDQHMLQALEQALQAQAGRPVNARTTYLKTRIRQLPIPQDELPDIAPGDPMRLGLQISRDDLRVSEYERSVTLLEAAQRNFGFTQYFSTEEQRASYISNDALSVIDFVKVAREVDLGRRIEQYLERNFNDQLSGPLFGVQGNQLILALWDAYRNDGPGALSQTEFNTLETQVFDSSFHWDAYQLDAGGEKIPIPFFTRRVDSDKGTRVYSYFPGRPAGALRSHFSVDEAVQALQHEVRNEVGLEKLAWFMGAISLNNQEKIRTFIKPLTVNRDRLYWHARILYDLFASKTPNTQKLRIERYGVEPRSLAHALPIHRGWVIQSDLIRLARNTRLADRESAVELLKYLISETLSMILLPVPGGVTGLSKVMLVATLGTLAYQGVEAVIALRQGRQSEAVQAVTDLIDLLVSARLQGVAHTLSTRRTRQLIKALGHPRHGIDTRGNAGLWFLDTYTKVDPDTLLGIEPDSKGLFEKNGLHYIRLTVDQQEKVARVIREADSGRYRLTHTGANFEPYVRYYPQQQRWVLDPVDTRLLGNAQWLQLMLPSDQVSLSLQGCQRSLDMAGISRQHLRGVWTARQEAPWPLLQAIEDQHLREQLGILRNALDQPDTPMPTVASRALPALLADLSRCVIDLYDSAGTTLLSSHAPLAATNERPAQRIELLQQDDGLYRTRSSRSTPDTLLPRVLLEYERLVPDGTLGKTGQNALDQHLEQRVLELRRKTARHLDQHVQKLHAALLNGQPRAHVNSQLDAHRFAPADRTGGFSPADTLRRRAPELSLAAAHDLVRRFPHLGDGEYTSITADAGMALQACVEQSRLVRSLGGISSPNGIGLDLQSEVLFGHFLTLLPGWPANVALQVYQATVDHAGHPIGRGPLLDTYGAPGADTFVMLVRSDNHYAGYLQHSGELHIPPAHQNSLTGATLLALTDPQRLALGREIHDTAGLGEDIIGQARLHHDHLTLLQTPSPLSPLSSQGLRDFRAFDMRQVSRTADADGIHEIGGRKYINIDQTAYQVMLDRDASSPLRKVWRIVKPTDPVASDSANLYNASRAGQTRPVCRNAANLWVSVQVGLAGGMRRAARTHDNRAFLLQRYEPIRQAFATLGTSNAQYNELLEKAIGLPQGSIQETAALVALEVHIRKHLKLLADYVKDYIDNKDWLILLKAGGLYKQELQEQQMNRIDFFNKLMAAMDRRILPTLEGPQITAEAYRKALVQLDKKLKVLEERQALEEQIKKTDRDAGPELERLNNGVPGAIQINYTKLNMLLHLLWENPHELPPVGMGGLTAAHLVMDDLKNVSGQAHPLALQLAQEQIRADKHAFRALAAAEHPTRVETINAILTLLDGFEASIEKRLGELFDQLDSNAQLPNFDQDIDFDFIPQQPPGSTQAPVTRKMFRTRQHGTYRVMVGDKQVATDGTVTLVVADPFQPTKAPRRYEKTQGEWRPVATRTDTRPLSELIGDARLELAGIDKHLEDALAQERQNANPTNIVEFLGVREDRLHDLATQLEATGEGGNNTDAAQLATRLRTAARSMNVRGHEILVRMYKNKEVLDVLRLNYLLDHAQVSVTRIEVRKQLGKGNKRSFLDVYSINDRANGAPLWEAHFHYDSKDRPAKDYTTKGAHLKTLKQSRLGSTFQQQEEQAGRTHKPIWREFISPRVAQKLFDQAS